MAPNNGDYKKFNQYLNDIPLEELRTVSEAEAAQAEKDFNELKEALSRGMCSYCGHSLSHFSIKKPCFHWLLKPQGFKKKHFSLLYQKESFHQINAYLRWIANCEAPLRNINDLVQEKTSSKIIEETIRYKNFEWSFSCSHGDMQGHPNAHKGNMPHYHFQMTVDSKVIINYGGFHIPFDEYDNFCFAVKRGEFERLETGHVQSAGMQTMFDNLTPEELLDLMKKSPDDDESKQQFHISTVVTADEGTKISGDDLADLMEEHNTTGVPLAKLMRKLKNVKAQSFISAGPGVPDIAARNPNRKKTN